MSSEPNEGKTAPQRRLDPGDEAAPGTPGTGEDVCRECQGTGKRGGQTCPNCGGTGRTIQGIGGA